MQAIYWGGGIGDAKWLPLSGGMETMTDHGMEAGFMGVWSMRIGKIHEDRNGIGR